YLPMAGKRSAQPITDVPNAIGMARPSAKASSSNAPVKAEALLAATPNNTARAGVQMGQTATEKGAPSANAPQRVLARRARNGNAGSRRRTQPTHTRPRIINTGPRTRPQ